MVRSADDLDAREDIARRIAAAGGAVGQIDRHAFEAERVIGHVDARAANQLVGSASTDEHVVSSAADQYIVATPAAEPVGRAIAFKRIAKVGSGEVLDSG